MRTEREGADTYFTTEEEIYDWKDLHGNEGESAYNSKEEGIPSPVSSLRLSSPIANSFSVSFLYIVTRNKQKREST